MDITERINKYEKKKGNSVQQTGQSASTIPRPNASQEISKGFTNAGTVQKMDASNVAYNTRGYDPNKPIEPTFHTQSVQQATDKMTSLDPINPQKAGPDGVDWRSLDYDSAIKFNPNLSRSQYISGAARYRKQYNKPGFTDDEIYRLLGGKDPFISAAEEQKNEKRMKTAGYIDSIGNVLANLVNYVRTRNGSPAMDLSPLKQNTARLEKLKAYHDALGRSNYASYMDMLRQRRAAEAAQAAAERKYMQELQMEYMRQNSPLTRSKMETEEERRKGYRLNNELTGLKAEEQKTINESLPDKLAAEIENTKARTAAAGRSNRGSSSGGKTDKENKEPKLIRLRYRNGSYSPNVYDLNKEEDVLKAYNEGIKALLWEGYFEKNDEGKYGLNPDDSKRFDLGKLNPTDIRRLLYVLNSNYITPESEDWDTAMSNNGKNNKPAMLGIPSSNDSENNKDNKNLDWKINE